MKIWLKYLIGIAIGLAAGVLFQSENAQFVEVLDFIVDIIIRGGRYILIPVMFFSISVACFKLRDEKMILKTGLWIIGVILVSTFTLTVLGLASALIFKLPRIPITTEKISDFPSLNVGNLIKNIFPYSGFETLINGAYLLPCFVFAGIAGAAAVFDKNNARISISLFDSLSRIFYNVMSFLTEILAIGIISIMTKWTIDFLAVAKTGAYNSLILMLTLNLLFISVVVYPLIIRFVCNDRKPYRVLYASLSSFFVAFFSGDTNLALALNLRNGKESLGIRRRCIAVTAPLLSIFARGGAALVQSVSFVLILRSYSSLGISFQDTMWIGMISFLLSFVLGEIPSGGPFIAVTLMCSMYGRGFESGFLLLKNAAPLLCAYAAGIDAITAVFGSYIVGVKTKAIVHQKLNKFI